MNCGRGRGATGLSRGRGGRNPVNREGKVTTVCVCVCVCVVSFRVALS